MTAFVLACAALLYGAGRQGFRTHRIGEPEPDFSKYSTPALEEALTEPQRLWQFLISPETGYVERRAAALRGAVLLSPEFVPRLVYALRELRREERLHRWGLEPHPMEAAPFLFGTAWQSVERDRMVLEQRWRLPDKRMPYPKSLVDKRSAPWPWQVQQVLGDVFVWMASQRREIGPADEQQRWVDRWLAACMRMPIATDEEASAFVEATSNGWLQEYSMPVMARWGLIALQPDMPEASVKVATNIAETARAWRDPRARAVAEIITAEIVRQGAIEETRARAAYGLRVLREKRAEQDAPLPEPVLAISAAAEKAVDPREGDEWRRLYVYAYSVAAALDQPPIQIDRSFQGPTPGSPEASDVLQRFEKWYDEHRPDLQARAAERSAAYTEVLAELDRAAEKK